MPLPRLTKRCTKEAGGLQYTPVPPGTSCDLSAEPPVTAGQVQPALFVQTRGLFWRYNNGYGSPSARLKPPPAFGLLRGSCHVSLAHVVCYHEFHVKVTAVIAPPLRRAKKPTRKGTRCRNYTQVREKPPPLDFILPCLGTQAQTCLPR